MVNAVSYHCINHVSFNLWWFIDINWTIEKWIKLIQFDSSKRNPFPLNLQIKWLWFSNILHCRNRPSIMWYPQFIYIHKFFLWTKCKFLLLSLLLNRAGIMKQSCGDPFVDNLSRESLLMQLITWTMKCLDLVNQSLKPIRVINAITYMKEKTRNQDREFIGQSGMLESGSEPLWSRPLGIWLSLPSLTHYRIDEWFIWSYPTLIRLRQHYHCRHLRPKGNPLHASHQGPIKRNRSSYAVMKREWPHAMRSYWLISRWELSGWS